MVLPLGEVILSSEVAVTEASELPSKTYRLDLKRGRCIGMIDGIEAIKQSIFKILNTVRFEHLIYTDNYGFEKLVGKDETLVRAEIPRRIEEALLQDERILSVKLISIAFNFDSVFVRISCVTSFGNIETAREVNNFV